MNRFVSFFVFFLCPLVTSTACGAAPYLKKADIPYVPGGGERQQLDLYLPLDYDKAEKPLPLICAIHGGGWSGGSKDQAAIVANLFVPRGYAVAGITCRFRPKDPMPAQIIDCKAAVRWLRAHAKEYNLDVDRFGVHGSSAGGHLAALLGTCETKEFDVGENLDQSSMVQVVVNFFGPSDFVGWVDEHPDVTTRVRLMYFA